MYNQETMYINPEIFEYLRDSHIKLQMGRYIYGKETLFKSLERKVLPSTFYAKKERYKNLATYQFHGKGSFLKSQHELSFRKNFTLYKNVDFGITPQDPSQYYSPIYI